MPETPGSVLHQQALLVMAFFAGFALTALVLVLGSPAVFHHGWGGISPGAYFATLITAVAVVGAVSVVGVLAAMEVAGGMAEADSPLDRFAYGCFLVGVFGLAAVLPLLLVPYSALGAALLVGLEAVFLALYFGLGRTSHPRARRPGADGSGAAPP